MLPLLPRLPPPPPPLLLRPLLFFTVPTNENGKNVLCDICTLLVERQVCGFPRIKMMDLSFLSEIRHRPSTLVKDIVDTRLRGNVDRVLSPSFSFSLSLSLSLYPYHSLPSASLLPRFARIKKDVFHRANDVFIRRCIRR